MTNIIHNYIRIRSLKCKTIVSIYIYISIYNHHHKRGTPVEHSLASKEAEGISNIIEPSCASSITTGDKHLGISKLRMAGAR